MKREAERLKREAVKKAMDEAKAEDKRKRMLEARSREDRTKKEREEREKERKAKEEQEARLAKERKAEKDRLDKEREEKEKKVAQEKAEKAAKAEKDAKEKLAAQQQATAAISITAHASGSSKGSARTNSAVASSSTATTPVKSNNSSTSSVTPPAIQRSPNNSSGSIGNGTPSKKPANKQTPTLITSPVPPGISNRPLVQQLNLSRPPNVPPSATINPQQQLPHLPPPPQSAGIMYGHPQMIPPPAMSPRVGSFPPMTYGYGGPSMPQQHHPPSTPLSPSGIPRGFNGGSFDPAFNRIPVGVGVSIGSSSAALSPPTPSPIGPPTKATKPPTQGAAAVSPSMLAPGQGRRPSAPVQPQSASSDAPGPGPITRPMAPIARPIVGGNGEAASSGSGSPNRRSPSPKGVLGSSALAADDDEVVSAHGPRRVGVSTPIGIGTMPIGGGALGQNWGGVAPRSIISDASLRGGPWTTSAFSSARAAIGPNSHLHQLHHPGPPPVSPSLWGNVPGSGNGENWQSPGFFPGSPYMSHNTAASSTPHTST